MEIHARNASHLVGQVIGDRRLQRKEADQDGDKQGGQAAVEQLAYQIVPTDRPLPPMKEST